MCPTLVAFTWLGIGEDANVTRELAETSKEKAEEAVASVQPILDTLDSDLESVNQVPILQDQMSLKLVQIKAKSTLATRLH